MLRLKGKKVLVVGLARTGVSVAQLLSQRGAVVFVTDLRNKTELYGPLKVLSKYKRIKYDLGRHTQKGFLSVDLIVVSPGVPSNSPHLEKARKKGVEIMSELEFAFNLISQPIIAVTGTNGKTTTTMMIGNMFKHAKKNVFVGGNIGNPLTNVLLSREKYQYIIAEVSSFQLEIIKNFQAKVAVVLNISSDHLDRHETMDQYRTIKSRIFQNQKKTDLLILNANDPLVTTFGDEAKSKVFYFKVGKLNPDQEGIYYEEGKFHLRSGKLGKVTFNARNMKIRGDHNRENFMAALLVAKILKCKDAALQTAIDSFGGVPHRLEYVQTRAYVDFYNDSKATNVDAVKRAVMSFQKPLIVIMGGRDKGSPFEELRSIIQKKVKILIILGEAKERINRAIGDYTETFVVGTLEEAVYMAYQKSRAGDVILFTPGCTSFDEFKDYADRGDHFKLLLKEL